MKTNKIGVMENQSYCPCGNITQDGRKCLKCFERQLEKCPSALEAYKKHWEEINKKYKEDELVEEKLYNL
jgi:hypothetical protein